jgi:mono/diheme cytochrome c family protein
MKERAMTSKMLRHLVIATPALLALQAAPAGAQGAADARGETLVTRHCAMCHAVGRSGASPLAIAPPFRTLGRRYPIESLEEGLGEGLMTGHPEMPEFRFAPRDVGAIVRYLKSVQEP